MVACPRTVAQKRSSTASSTRLEHKVDTGCRDSSERASFDRKKFCNKKPGSRIPLVEEAQCFALLRCSVEASRSRGILSRMKTRPRITLYYLFMVMESISEECACLWRLGKSMPALPPHATLIRMRPSQQVCNACKLHPHFLNRTLADGRNNLKRPGSFISKASE